MPNNHIGDSTTKRHRPNSRILTWVDKFCDLVYDRLARGLFGTVFTKYPSVENTLFGRLCESDVRKKKLAPARRAVASKLENSTAAGMYRSLVSYLLSVRLKIYGAFIFSFLIYTAIFAAIGIFRGRSEDILSALLPAFISIGVIPAFFTEKSLAAALCSSRLGMLLLRVTGVRPERLDTKRRTGRGDMAFIAALALGLMTLRIPFWIIPGAIAAFCAVAVIMHSPEFGTVCLFFFMPILPTAALVALEVLTIFSFLLKALLARRVFRIESVDLALLPYICMLFVGTLFGASWSSLKLGSLTVVIVSCFYLVVFTMSSREWLRRAVIAMVTSCTAISFYGLVQYVGQKVLGTASANGWVDEHMFGYITGRAVATLENPNMLSVYLIIVLPVALCALITLAHSLRQRAIALVAFAAIGLCLVFTWTRGAWLGALLSFVIFIMIWSRRSIYVFICGVLSLPFLQYIVPANIWARFTSIGNFNDSSSAFRVNILKSVSGLLPQFMFNGIGLGEDSWYVIWPKIAINGVEWTSHTHNLYIQIWVQTGFVSLILFLAFILMMFLSNFNFYRRLKDADEVIMSHISVASVKDYSPARVRTEPAGDSAEKKKTVMRLEAAAPLCGITAALLMGFTDYIWYNYRVVLSFWLACGLSAAYVRVGRRELEYSKTSSSPTEAAAQIPLAPKKTKGKDF